MIMFIELYRHAIDIRFSRFMKKLTYGLNRLYIATKLLSNKIIHFILTTQWLMMGQIDRIQIQRSNKAQTIKKL